MKKDSLPHIIKEGLYDTCYIWVRELKNTIKDEGVLIFCIIVPLFYPLLYSWIYTNEVVRDVPVAIVDQDYSHASREFIRFFNSTPEGRVAYSCNSLEEAKELIGKHEVYGIIYLTNNFEKKLMRSQQAQVEVYCDMSMMLTYKAIYQAAQAVATKMNSDLQKHSSRAFTTRDEELIVQPVTVDEIPIFNPTTGYGNALLPGVLILILQQTLLLGIGLAAGTIRENNRYHDLVPISKHYNGIFRIVIGKAACFFTLYMVLAAYITLVVPKLFGYLTLVTAQSIMGLMIPYILSCIFFGMVLSCVVRYRENVTLLVVFTSIPFLFLTGISWPQSNIPGIIEGLAALVPSTFGVRGYLRISSMGATIQDIRSEYMALWIQTLIYFVLACFVYRYQLKQTRRRAFNNRQLLKEKAIEAKNKKIITLNAQSNE